MNKLERVYQQYWIDLPKQVREHLAKAFSMNRTGITEIRDQTVISDGYSNTDLEAITSERMKAYVGESSESTVSFARLWELTLAKAHYELNPPVMTIGEDTVEAPKSTRYCNTCASQKGRHYKGCPKFK